MDLLARFTIARRQSSDLKSKRTLFGGRGEDGESSSETAFAIIGRKTRLKP